jgi:hypothetical protein
MPPEEKSQPRVLKELDSEARSELQLRCSNRGHGDVANRGHQAPVAANAARSIRPGSPPPDFDAERWRLLLVAFGSIRPGAIDPPERDNAPRAGHGAR